MTTTLARRRAAADPARAYPTSRGELTPEQIRRLAATGMRVLITRLEPAHEQSRLELYPHEDVLIVTDDDRRALPRWTAELGSPVLEVAEYHRQLLHEEITRMPPHERIELFYTERELRETLLMTIRTRGTTAMRATFAPVVDPQRLVRLQALVPAARFQLPTAARRALDPVQAWPLIEQAVRAAGLSEDICKLLVATAAAAETPEAIASIPIPTPRPHQGALTVSVPHALNAGAHRQGLTLVLTGGPRTVLDTHPHYDRLRCAAAHPASTPTFLTRLAEDSQPAEAAR